MSLVLLRQNIEALKSVVFSYENLKKNKADEIKLKPLRQQILYLNVAIKKQIEEEKNGKN